MNFSNFSKNAQAKSAKFILEIIRQEAVSSLHFLGIPFWKGPHFQVNSWKQFACKLVWRPDYRDYTVGDYGHLPNCVLVRCKADARETFTFGGLARKCKPNANACGAERIQAKRFWPVLLKGTLWNSLCFRAFAEDSQTKAHKIRFGKEQ